MPITIARLWFEHHNPKDAIGIGEPCPRLSWRFQGDTKDWKQAVYELEVSRGNITKNFHVDGEQSVLVAWPDSPLKSREIATVRVRVKGVHDAAYSSWSTPETVETGLLVISEWGEAEFIGSSLDRKADPYCGHRPIVFQKKFVMEAGAYIGRLYITAHGVYEASINGKSVGDQLLAPGWTSYDHQILYQTYDVSGLLGEENTLEVVVGDGWWAGRDGYEGNNRDVWGDRLGVICALVVEDQYGEVVAKVVSKVDDSWQTRFGPIISSEIQHGETYDARLEKRGHDWHPVVSQVSSKVTLRAPVGPPVRVVGHVKAKEILSTKDSNTKIVDFGQNLVGWLHVKVTDGAAGREVVFKHCEVLENGWASMRPLRAARATDRLILTDGELVWEPTFTYHGFRYVQVENWPGDLTLQSLEAVVIGSDMERTGWFECSHVMLNQLHHNVVWSNRGNFVSIPTDCPQRDERLGWTGDIQIFGRTAGFLFDTAGFLQSWMSDVQFEQLEDGSGIVPMYVPMCNKEDTRLPMAVWGDLSVLTPWDQYNSFGDIKLLEDQLEGMVAWIKQGIPKRGPDHILWDTKFQDQFGDWLDPMAPPAEPGNGRTNQILVADAYLIHITDVLAKVYRTLNMEKEAVKYEELAVARRKAFAEEYITSTGNVVSDSQTAISLVLYFNLAPSAAVRERLSEHLDYLVRAVSNFKIGTGFVGTPLIGPVLTEIGKEHVFYRMLLSKKNPSWLYPVSMGATTIWERWDSMLEDGSVNPGQMTSFNHYALGAVAEWLHGTMAGLSPAAPGWKKISVVPKPGGGLTFAKATHVTPYGLAEAGWKINGDSFDVHVIIPPNTSASVKLPGWETPVEIGSGIYDFSAPHIKPVWPVNGIHGYLDAPEEDAI